MWYVLVRSKKLLLKTIRLVQKPSSHLSAETYAGLLSLTLLPIFTPEIFQE